MVTKYKNILSEELYIELVEYINTLIKDKPHKFGTTNLLWENGLIENSASIVRYDFDISDILINKKIRKEIENKIPYMVKGFCLHLWPNLSYITWHNDYHVKGALTIYLNEKWDANWGGYLMYKENSEIKAIKPERNLGVLQENNVEHSVTTINIGAEQRISLQFFLEEKVKTTKTIL